MPKPSRRPNQTTATPDPPTLWRSRITGHDAVPPDSLLANPLNHRRHPQQQRDALAASIHSVGFVRSVTVNRITGHIVDGHERVWQAIAAGTPTIDVEYVELSEAEEKLILATLDKITELATVDAAALQALLAEVETNDERLQSLLAEMANDAGLTPDDDPLPTEPLAEAFQILIECDSEQQQLDLLARFTAEGLACRSLIV